MIGAIVYQSFHEGMLEVVGGLKRWLSFYAFPLIGFGGTHISVIGDKEIEHGFDINYKRFDNLEQALEEWKDVRVCFLVGKHPDDKQPVLLEDYEHPKDVIYVVGMDYGDIEFDKLKKNKDKYDFVHIDTKNNFSAIWSHTVLGITLWDRFRKNGSN